MATTGTCIFVMGDKEDRNTKNSSAKMMEATLLRLEESFKKMDVKLDDNIKTII
jgi:hypothetical protein